MDAAGQVAPILSADDIQALIAARHEARRQKDYAKADEIRGQLKAHNIVLEDTGPEQTNGRGAVR